MAEVSDLHLVSSLLPIKKNSCNILSFVYTLQCQDNFAKICQITFGKSAVKDTVLKCYTPLVKVTLLTTRKREARKGWLAIAFTFHSSIFTLSNAFLSINKREMKSESDFSLAMASQPFGKVWHRTSFATSTAKYQLCCWPFHSIGSFYLSIM